MLLARFDGGCWPNPKGHCACACVVTRNGTEIYRETRYLGCGDGMTNNVAEFNGLLLILRWFNDFLRNHKEEPILIIGDSLLVINRMSKWKSKPSDGVCMQASKECLEAASWNRRLLAFKWQRREENEVCDGLCDEMISAKRSEPERAFLPHP